MCVCVRNRRVRVFLAFRGFIVVRRFAFCQGDVLSGGAFYWPRVSGEVGKRSLLPSYMALYLFHVI